MTGKVIAAIALAVLAAGCSKEHYGSSKTTTPYVTPSTNATASGTQVDVRETEYSISLSRTTFTPGTYTFVVHDVGRATHALEIDGPGVSDKKSSDLDPGGSTSLTVTLKAGTYRVYCPVANHADQGMDTHITVA